jgi:hypothetical protein
MPAAFSKKRPKGRLASARGFTSSSLHFTGQIPEIQDK